MRVTEAGHVSLAQGCPLLQQLRLYGCKPVTDTSLAAFARLSHLRLVDLCGAELITDRGLKVMTCPNLRAGVVFDTSAAKGNNLRIGSSESQLRVTSSARGATGGSTVAVKGCSGLLMACSCPAEFFNSNIVWPASLLSVLRLFPFFPQQSLPSLKAACHMAIATSPIRLSRQHAHQISSVTYPVYSCCSMRCMAYLANAAESPASWGAADSRYRCSPRDRNASDQACNSQDSLKQLGSEEIFVRLRGASC